MKHGRVFRCVGNNRTWCPVSLAAGGCHLLQSKLLLPVPFFVHSYVMSFIWAQNKPKKCSKHEHNRLTTFRTVLQFGLGVGIASNIRVGHYLGGNNPLGAKTVCRTAITMISQSLFLCASLFFGKVPCTYTDSTDVLIPTQGMSHFSWTQPGYGDSARHSGPIRCHDIYKRPVRTFALSLLRFLLHKTRSFPKMVLLQGSFGSGRVIAAHCGSVPGVWRSDGKKVFACQWTLHSESFWLLSSTQGLFHWNLALSVLQAVSTGVLRGCGRQHVAASVVFVTYLFIALPVGISLMFLTSLRMSGTTLSLAWWVIPPIRIAFWFPLWSAELDL